MRVHFRPEETSKRWSQGLQFLIDGWDEGQAGLRSAQGVVSLRTMFLVDEKQMGRDSFGGRKGRFPLDLARRSRLTRMLSLLLWATVLAQGAGAGAENSYDLDKCLQETEAALGKVDNYTAVFHRIEFVDGKLIPEEVTVLKFKRPFKIYMKWITPSKGQESLYVEGANKNKIRAHASGLIGLVTVNLDPTGKQAMENSRHPITEAGLHNLVDKISANLRRGLRAGELVSKDRGEQTVYGRKTTELEGILPRDPSKGYYCYRCIVNVDLETRMPIKVQIFDRDDRLVESYGYELLKLNPGLTDKDFDPKNPEYHF